MRYRETMKRVVQWIWFVPVFTVALSAEETTSVAQYCDTVHSKGLISIRPIANIVAFAVVDNTSTIENQSLETQPNREKSGLQVVNMEIDNFAASFFPTIHRQLMLLAIGVSFLATLCLIMIALRTSSGGVKAPRHGTTDDALFCVAGTSRTQQAENPQPCEPLETENFPHTSTDSTLRKKRTYSIPQSEETALAMKFKHYSSTAVVARKIGLLLKQPVLDHRVSLARKAGIGRGEIELALHLQELQALVGQQGRQP